MYIDEVLQEELKRLIEMTDKTWVKGILCMAKPDVNIKGKPYKGINTFILALERAVNGFDSNEWLTFKGVSELGGTVKKGAKSTRIILWMPNPEYAKLEMEYKKAPTEELKGKMRDTWKFVLKAYHVFNKAQTDLPYDKLVDVELPNEPVKACEELLEKFTDAPRIVHESISTAYYSPCTDEVHCPDIRHFSTSENYYGTLFHELAHSTGHESRLKRKMEGSFGSSSYAKEELIAEISACMMNAECGLQEELENHAVYLKSWLRKALGDKATNLVNAFNSADKAIAWIHGNH